jgi:nicotinic acid phosphoribosyltransferase
MFFSKKLRLFIILFLSYSMPHKSGEKIFNYGENLSNKSKQPCFNLTIKCCGLEKLNNPIPASNKNIKYFFKRKKTIKNNENKFNNNNQKKFTKINYIKNKNNNILYRFQPKK